MLQRALFARPASLAEKLSSAFHRQTRLIHRNSTSVKSPRSNKDGQDILSLRSSENVKSCTDDYVASLDKPSYTRSEPDPEAARESATEQSNDIYDPLEFSGANQELSKPMGDGGSWLETAARKDSNGNKRASYMGSRARQRRR